MDEMNDTQRKVFIDRRVNEILRAYNENVANLSAMTEDQRDDFVHRRVEYDLAIFESISREQAAHIALHEIIWRFILVLDGIALVAFVGLALRDWKDILAFVITAAVFATSRVVNFYLLRQSRKVLDLMYKHASREANTASLDFLVDDIHVQEDNPSP